jgi:hypothetical protein
MQTPWGYTQYNRELLRMPASVLHRYNNFTVRMHFVQDDIYKAALEYKIVLLVG